MSAVAVLGLIWMIAVVLGIWTVAALLFRVKSSRSSDRVPQIILANGQSASFVFSVPRDLPSEVMERMRNGLSLALKEGKTIVLAGGMRVDCVIVKEESVPILSEKGTGTQG